MKTVTYIIVFGIILTLTALPRTVSLHVSKLALESAPITILPGLSHNLHRVVRVRHLKAPARVFLHSMATIAWGICG